MKGKLQSIFLLFAIISLTLLSSFELIAQADFPAILTQINNSKYDEAKNDLKEIRNKNLSKLSNRDKGILYMYLGRVEQLTSDYDSSIWHFHLALDHIKPTGDYSLEAECFTWIGEYYRALSKYDDGIKYLGLAERIIENHQVSDYSKALYYTRRAAFANELLFEPSRSDVFKYSNMALELARKMDNKFLEATAINEIGFAYENMQDPRARSNYLEAYKIWLTSGNEVYAANALVNVVRESIKRRDFNEAIKYAHIGYDIAIRRNILALKVRFSASLMQAYEHSGNLVEGLNYSHIYHDWYEIESMQQSAKYIVDVERKYDLKNEKEKLKFQKARTELANLKVRQERKQRNYLYVIVFVLCMFMFVILALFYKIQTKNRALLKSLDEKQVLLQEVHHRVKNNLSFLSSLLYLRTKTIDNQETIEVLLECQSRVNSMAVVHEELYQINENEKPSFRSFCLKLFEGLNDSIYLEDKSLNFELIGDVHGLNLTRSIFVGLIINELAMNSIKHASTSNELKIGVELKQIKNRIIFRYFDNGIGLNDQVNIAQSSGFGLRMIQLLIRQLNSDLIYERKNELSQFKFEITIS